jgi:hypothetical protein
MSDELKERNILKFILMVRFACATLNVGHPMSINPGNFHFVFKRNLMRDLPTRQFNHSTSLMTTDYRVSRKSPAPSQFQQAIDMVKRILFDSLIYSPSFSATQARCRIQSRNTLWTSSKVRSFHTCVIAPSISSLEEKSRSLRICFNFPKSQNSRGFTSGEQGRCDIL